MPPIYLSIANVQPFADMSSEEFEDGVQLVRGDGKVCGLRLERPELVLRLPDVIESLDLDPERVWSRLKGDADVLGSRAATWGGGGP